MGAQRVFEIWTDHANLQFFKKPQNLNRRQVRWYQELQEYHFTLHHIPGKANSKADILSRQPGFEEGTDDNNDIVLLPEMVFSTENTLLLNQIHELTPITFIPDILRNRTNIDESVKKALERRDESYQTFPDGVITNKGRIYIPANRRLRGEIIAQHHDTPLSGHYGQYKTLEKILRDYWWPSVSKDIQTYIDGCDPCQKNKPRRVPKKTPLHPFNPSDRPWETITVDLIGPLPESQGYNTILVIVDQATKAVKFEATHLELSSEGFARLLRDRVVRDHGWFKRIVHDQDTCFVSKYLTELCKLLHQEKHFGSEHVLGIQNFLGCLRASQSIPEHLRVSQRSSGFKTQIWRRYKHSTIPTL
jgi:hypothetical protein